MPTVASCGQRAGRSVPRGHTGPNPPTLAPNPTRGRPGKTGQAKQTLSWLAAVPAGIVKRPFPGGPVAMQHRWFAARSVGWASVSSVSEGAGHNPRNDGGRGRRPGRWGPTIWARRGPHIRGFAPANGTAIRLLHGHSPARQWSPPAGVSNCSGAGGCTAITDTSAAGRAFVSSVSEGVGRDLENRGARR